MNYFWISFFCKGSFVYKLGEGELEISGFHLILEMIIGSEISRKRNNSDRIPISIDFFI